MLPPGKSVASRITHRRWTGGTALLSQRRGLLNEAEEEFGHIRLFRFASAFRATLSRCLLRIQQSSVIWFLDLKNVVISIHSFETKIDLFIPR